MSGYLSGYEWLSQSELSLRASYESIATQGQVSVLIYMAYFTIYMAYFTTRNYETSLVWAAARATWISIRCAEVAPLLTGCRALESWPHNLPALHSREWTLHLS